MAVLRLFPHCDIHLTLGNAATKTVDFRLVRYLGGSPFTLDDVTVTSTAQFLAPHNPVGSRLERFVNIDFVTQKITATKVGTNLVIFREPVGDNGYIVARIQVHQDIQAWWFGNRSITTAVDTTLGHSQPSIYAMFSDDPTGTDRVGDITGHGFVTLTPDDPAKFVVMNANKEGRLRGVAEGHATLNGSFLGINDSMGVDVVDYSKPRDILVPVRAGDLANASKRHNILFLAEGFKSTAADQDKFDKIVTEVTNDLFSKPRHEPFATLSSSFNVFKAFMPSNDQLITCGFRVADAAVPSLAKGTPIPYEFKVSGDDKYTVAQLVARVGLPMRGEARSEADLKTLWNSQSLDNFDATKVDAAVVEAWKNSHALGFLEARDTFLGMKVGSRWADKGSSTGSAIATPAADDGTAPLQALVKRAYEFYKLGVSRSIGLDGRRHPPELQLTGHASPTNTVMNFVGSLRVKDPPHEALGSGWVPTAGAFKPSRGLIAMIINEPMDGGTNLNDSTITANNVRSETALSASYVPHANASIKRLRRDGPANIDPEVTAIANTVAHEFGHSFALGDEYEEFLEYPNFRQDFLDPADGRPNQFDDNYDNVASLEAVFNDPAYLANNSRKIDPSKIKWRHLPRIKLSARSTAASQVNAGKLEIAIDPREANAWEAARPAGEEVHLRRIVVQPSGRQLPLSTADADHLTGLKIDSVDVAGGKVVLSSSSPLAPPPNFPEGSSLFVPYRTAAGVLSIIEEKVFAELTSSRDPLNKDTDTAKTNSGPDFPRDIGDFKPPCQSSRLIGLFEGAGTWTGLVYRPAGTCKMRTSGGENENGEFCHVCKWLITQRVDAGKHQEIDRKFYPKAKKNE
jgi:hypothetical protein